MFNFLYLTFLVHFLKPGDVIENNKPGLQTFCHSAKPKHVKYMWESLTVRNKFGIHVKHVSTSDVTFSCILYVIDLLKNKYRKL